ncbi:MAG: NGG1p interacting factor NIF3 [Candidatus Aenigmarchaeota archaeon]|nr:NGG1p interacting factor NIF3 [Candidatus Aenigmarchaeota archaeon]
MASLKELHEFAVKEGIKEDPRGEQEIKRILDETKEKYNDLKGYNKEYFDKGRTENPFADSLLLNDENAKNIESVAIGIDIETPEMLLIDRLKQKGTKIDAVITHHPEGRALAALHQVMDMQIRILHQSGVPISQAEAIVRPRVDEVRRGLHPFNHTRTIDSARLLNIPFMSMHTIADNHVHTFLQKLLDKEKPRTIKNLLDILYKIPEYQWAASHGMGPTIFVGNSDNECGKITFDMTGGTELDKSRMKIMAESGINTIVAMHMSKDQYEEAKSHNINVVAAGHMSSDSLGMNLVLDKMEKKFKLKIVEISGFKRVKRN